MSAVQIPAAYYFEQLDPDKHEATLIASLAVRGHAVHKLQIGGYLVCWTGYSRHCSDIESLDAFARQVGAVR